MPDRRVEDVDPDRPPVVADWLSRDEVEWLGNVCCPLDTVWDRLADDTPDDGTAEIVDWFGGDVPDRLVDALPDDPNEVAFFVVDIAVLGWPLVIGI